MSCECFQYPHHPSCPDAEDKHVYECDWCGGYIYNGERYLEINGDKICESCFEDMIHYAEGE